MREQFRNNKHAQRLITNRAFSCRAEALRRRVCKLFLLHHPRKLLQKPNIILRIQAQVIHLVF
jgi:hypothetical protein